MKRCLYFIYLLTFPLFSAHTESFETVSKEKVKKTDSSILASFTKKVAHLIQRPDTAGILFLDNQVLPPELITQSTFSQNTNSFIDTSIIQKAYRSPFIANRLSPLKNAVKIPPKLKVRKQESSIIETSTRKPYNLSKQTAAIPSFKNPVLPSELIKESTLSQRPNSSISKPIIQKAYPSPLIASGLSACIAGLGHVYLENPLQACAYFSFHKSCEIYAIKSMIDIYLQRMFEDIDDETYIKPDEPLPYPQEVATIGRQSYYYSIYAAYRDARMLNPDTYYHYKIPNDTLASLMYAPFSFQIMKKPEVWGGILGSLGLAGLVQCLFYPSFEIIERMNTDTSYVKCPFTAFAIGLGEESLFRGVIQSILIEESNPSLGIFLSSVLFGIAHLNNAKIYPKGMATKYYLFAIPLISALGGYSGYLTYKNQSLQEAVAVHGWYDFILLTLDYLSEKHCIQEDACIQKPKQWSFSWSF